LHAQERNKEDPLTIYLFPSLTAFKRARVTALFLLLADVTAQLEQGYILFSLRWGKYKKEGCQYDWM